MISLGAAKLTTSQIHPESKPRRAIFACICSNASTARDLMLLTLSNALSGNTASTRSSMPKNTLISGKLGETQSVQA